MAETGKSRHGINEQQKQAVTEQLWLTYYNDTLFAKGLITEEQRNRLRLMIKHRTEGNRCYTAMHRERKTHGFRSVGSDFCEPPDMASKISRTTALRSCLRAAKDGEQTRPKGGKRCFAVYQPSLPFSAK